MNEDETRGPLPTSQAPPRQPPFPRRWLERLRAFSQRPFVALCFSVVLTALLFSLIDLGVSLTWPCAVQTYAGRLRDDVDVAPVWARYGRSIADVKSMNLKFKPSEDHHAVFLLFAVSGREARDSFDALTMSGSPSLPSSFIRYRNGRQTQVRLLPALRTPLESSDFVLDFSPSRVQVSQDGRAAVELSVDPTMTEMYVALYPQWPMMRLTRHLLDEVHISRVELKSGEVQTFPGPWRHSLWRHGIWLALLALLLASGRLRRRLAAVMLTLVLGCYGLLVLAFLWFMLTQNMHDWTEPFKVDGVLDPKRLLAAKSITIKDATVQIRHDPKLIDVMAFGGSTTRGDPFRDESRNSYPAQLEDMLNASTAFGGRKFQVMNLGNLGNNLEENLEIMEPMVAGLHPRVVILSSVINNYYSMAPWAMVAHATGHPSVQHTATAEQLKEYAGRLRQAVKICRDNGAQPVWIEEFVDARYFGGDAFIKPLQRTLAEVAAAEQVPLLRFQDEIDRDPDRLIFWEFIHLRKVGYRRMATRLLEWFQSPEGRRAALDPRPAGVTRGQATPPAVGSRAQGSR